MSARKALDETYIEGFRQGDHDLNLSCPSDDIVWELPGYASLTGKAAFDKEIENDAFVGRPKLTIERLIEKGERVVAVGCGEAGRRDGPLLSFVFSDVFIFTDDKISRLESYVVNHS